jgi:hypothetical protein
VNAVVNCRLKVGAHLHQLYECRLQKGNVCSIINFIFIFPFFYMGIINIKIQNSTILPVLYFKVTSIITLYGKGMD